jgi:hypothetical protein
MTKTCHVDEADGQQRVYREAERWQDVYSLLALLAVAS